MAKEPRSLNGKVVAITGAARGIGAATVQALIAKGARVAIGDVDAATAQSTADRLGAGTIAIELDVTRRESVARFLDEVDEKLGPVDVLINNAGIMPLGPFVDESDDTTQRMIEINVNGVLNGMKEVLPRFSARGSGHLVNIASTAGKGGFPGGATYCGTKHFVIGVSEAVRAEMRDTGIEVSCVMPVVVKTELASGLQETRGIKHIRPEDVADSIVDALEFPRFDVFVPKSAGRITALMGVLPRPARDLIAHGLKADRVLADFDHDQRRNYELRAAASAPGLEAGDNAPELPERTGAR